MSIGERISSFIRNKKMSIEEKIIYLTYLYDSGMDFNTIQDNYATKDKVLVKNVIHNIQRLFEKNRLSINQILSCEKIGITFEAKTDINDQIEFLKKAEQEGVSLGNIIQNSDEFYNTIIFKYICNIRKKFDENKLTTGQIYTCEKELKIILSKEEKKRSTLKKVKESALKNITFSNDIEKILSAQ